MFLTLVFNLFALMWNQKVSGNKNLWRVVFAVNTHIGNTFWPHGSRHKSKYTTYNSSISNCFPAEQNKMVESCSVAPETNDSCDKQPTLLLKCRWKLNVLNMSHIPLVADISECLRAKWLYDMSTGSCLAAQYIAARMWLIGCQQILICMRWL